MAEKRYVYALKPNSEFVFQCLSKTEEELNVKIDIAYYNWKACKSKDLAKELKSKEVFMKNFVKVKVTIELI